MLVPTLVFVAPALAAPGVASPAAIVWMQPAPPSAEAQEKAGKIVGGAVAHRAWPDLALTPEPATQADTDRIAALGRVIAEGQAKWQEFDAEAGIARAIGANVEPVALVRDEADRNALIVALLWEGAGITRPYPESLFNSLEDTAPFRIAVANQVVVRPWLDALALDPARSLARTDFPDGQSMARVKALQDQLALLPRAALTVDPLPPGVEAVVDGRTLAAGKHELPPGHHYAHLVRNGVVGNRMEFDVLPGGNAALPVKVSADEIGAAHASVLAGSADVPNDVATGIRALEARSGSPRVFLGATDDKGRPVVVAFSGGAVIEKKRPVTVMFTGSLGGGALESSGFSGNRGESEIVPAFGGDLGFEVGIYNAVIQLGGAMNLAPTAQFAYGTEGGETAEDNNQTSAMFQPHAGLGVYLPRPAAKKAFFLVAGNFGWLSPGALGFGAELAAGIPLGDGKTWFRVGVNGFRGEQMTGFAAEGTPTSALMLRVGFASLL